MEHNIKTIHGLVLAHGALLQAIAWSQAKNSDILYEFSQQYIPIIQGLNKEENPDEELITAVEDAIKSISAQLPKR